MAHESDICVASMLCYFWRKKDSLHSLCFSSQTRSFGRENFPFWEELIFLRGILECLLANAIGYGDG